MINGLILTIDFYMKGNERKIVDLVPGYYGDNKWSKTFIKTYEGIFAGEKLPKNVIKRDG